MNKGNIPAELSQLSSLQEHLDFPLPFGDCISFKFPLMPVARDQVDMFESLLRDSQDEISVLKASVSMAVAV